MAVGGRNNIWTPPRKAGGIPSVSIMTFSLSMENKRTGQSNLSRETKFSGANNGDRETIHFPCSAGHEQDWQPYPMVVVHTLLKVLAMHKLLVLW